MTPYKRRKILFFAISFLSITLGTVIFINIFRENLVFFHTPSEIKEKPQTGRFFRLGGMVEKGSFKDLQPAGCVSFLVGDGIASIKVHYGGILPDLFQEGKGVVVEGKMISATTMEATRVLARHDENYRPPLTNGALTASSRKTLEKTIMEKP